MRVRSHPDHHPRSRRIVAGAVTAAVALATGALAATPAQAADPVNINLVTVNDFHGRIEQSLPSGGIASLANAVNDIRATNPNTIFAAAGDMIGASTFTSFIQDDNPTIDALNLAGLDVSAAGNHEFDKGWDDLRGRVQSRANWEYISANVWDTVNNKYALAPYWLKQFDGVTIGFIGAVTEELPALVSPAGIADLAVRPIVDSVNTVADELSDGNPANGEADVLVLLVHEGASQPTLESVTDLSTPFGKIVAGVNNKVDAIVSGHTHLAYNLVVNNRPVISSGQYGEKFSDMKISVDPGTKQILSMVNTTYSMSTGSGSTSDPYKAKPEYAPGPAEQPIVDLVAESVAYAKVAGGVKVGDITGSFQRGIQPRTPTPTDPATTQEARGAESTLGNFVADVQLDQAQVRFPDTQIAFMNPGGLRADLKYASGGAGDPDGNVTYAEAAGVQPFANTLVTMSLTGAQIKAVLEEQWQPSTASRPFLKLGVSKGLTYVTDYAAPAGSHITNLELDGVAVDPAATYRVVVNSFLGSGGDNFFTLGKGTNKADSGIIDLEAMVAWFKLNGEASPDLAQRSIGVSLSPAASAKGYEVGTQVKVDLSSLDYTQTPTPVTSATVAIGGVTVGTAPVDRTLVPLTDEFGKASLMVTIPEGATGSAALGEPASVPLTITTSTGTSFEVPISVFDRAASVTTGAPNKTFANSKGNGVIQYMGTITAEGGTPVTGTAKIYDGDTAIATITLTAADKGAIKLKLPTLGQGSHPLKLVYEGSDTVQPSESATVTVEVK